MAVESMGYDRSTNARSKSRSIRTERAVLNYLGSFWRSECYEHHHRCDSLTLHMSLLTGYPRLHHLTSIFPASYAYMVTQAAWSSRKVPSFMLVSVPWDDRAVQILPSFPVPCEGLSVTAWLRLLVFISFLVAYAALISVRHKYHPRILPGSLRSLLLSPYQ